MVEKVASLLHGVADGLHALLYGPPRWLVVRAAFGARGVAGSAWRGSVWARATGASFHP